MKLMTHSPKGHIGAAKHTCGPRPFLYVLGDGRIELIYEVRICHVKLVRINANDRTYRGYQLGRSSHASSLRNTIDLVHFLDFPDVRASFDDIEIELVPEGQSCQFSTREMSDGRKIKAINDPVGSIQRQRYCGEFDKENVDLHVDTTTS